MPEVQLSTMWARRRAEHISDFFRAGQAAGFNAFELGHHVQAHMLDGAKPGEWPVPSIHAPCPNPSTLRGLTEGGILVSARDDGKRRQAVADVLRTIDLATEWGANAVVVHLGRVYFDRPLEEGLRELYRQGQKDSQDYKAGMESLIETRAKNVEPHLEATAKSLREIADYAAARGIAIGLENRFYYEEIPSFEEMGMLLAEYPAWQVGYWHDTGHAQALANLGFTPHSIWLAAYSSRMIGVHLHDVVGIKDHRIAGGGEIDFRTLASYIPHQALRVCEFGHDYSAEEIAQGREHLKEAGCLG